MQSNYYEGKAALIKISEYYTKMELFGTDGRTCDSAVFVFSCRLLKTELFENDDVTVSKTPRVDGEIIKNGKSFCAFKRRRTHLDGQKRHKNSTCGKTIFEKRRKKKVCVFNENGYVWTAPDSINLDANTR